MATETSTTKIEIWQLARTIAMLLASKSEEENYIAIEIFKANSISKSIAHKKITAIIRDLKKREYPVYAERHEVCEAISYCVNNQKEIVNAEVNITILFPDNWDTGRIAVTFKPAPTNE